LNEVARTAIKVTKVAKLEGHKGAIYDFSIDSESALIYSCSADGSIVKWDPLNSLNGILVLQADAALYSIYLDESKGVLYAGSMNGTLFGIKLQTAELLFERKFESAIYSIDSFGETLLVACGDGSIRSDKNEHILQLSSKPIRTLCVSNQHCYAGSSDGAIYDINDQFELRGTLISHNKSVFALEILSDDLLLSAGRDALIKMWDRKIGKPIREVPAHMYQIKSLSRRGGHILSSSMDKTIKVWNLDLELQKVIDFERYQGHTNCINKVKWLDDRMFVSSSDDRTLRVWTFEINV
jgi:WD40 repeat protein